MGKVAQIVLAGLVLGAFGGACFLATRPVDFVFDNDGPWLRDAELLRALRASGVAALSEEQVDAVAEEIVARDAVNEGAGWICRGYRLEPWRLESRLFEDASPMERLVLLANPLDAEEAYRRWIDGCFELSFWHITSTPSAVRVHDQLWMRFGLSLLMSRSAIHERISQLRYEQDMALADAAIRAGEDPCAAVSRERSTFCGIGDIDGATYVWLVGPEGMVEHFYRDGERVADEEEVAALRIRFEAARSAQVPSREAQ